MTQPNAPTTVVTKHPWSYSALTGYETCAKRFYHYNVVKDVREPESEQLRAGNALHRHFAARIDQGTPLPLGFGMYENMLARIVAAPGIKYVEQKLAINYDFAPTTYFAKDVWFRTVIDLAVIRGDNTATVFDWKDGKVKEDTTQLQLMAAAMFIHMPNLARVRSALVFVQHKQTEREDFLREDQKEIWSEVLPRVRALDTARMTGVFAPQPSGLCRKYCQVVSCLHYGK